MNDTEEWRPVLGWEDTYEVSNLGRVRSLDRIVPGRWAKGTLIKGRMLKPGIAPTTGYRRCTLVDARTGRRWYAMVHRLVLDAFVGPCPEGMECCHGDLDRGNATLSNLRWDTRSANTLDAVRHKTNAAAAKTHCPRGHAYDMIENRGAGRNPNRACKKCQDDLRRARTGQRERSLTHCIHGHLLDGTSKRADGTPRRYCKTCNLERSRRQRAAKQQKS